MTKRKQRTIATTAEVHGIGFLTGADVTLRFLPAPADFGIAFQRTDLPGSVPVPALVEQTDPCARRTVIQQQQGRVELVEHVMAALAGLRIDNCLVQLDQLEPPGLDGSCWEFVQALTAAEIVEQDAEREVLSIEREVRVTNDQNGSSIVATPADKPGLTISFELDYSGTAIGRQTYSVTITPETFVKELAFARTFLLEAEVEGIRAQGYGSRTTYQDLLIFGPEGVIENAMHCPDECVRHKILDCVGDFALIGCDIEGHLHASRSGHILNSQIIQKIKETHTKSNLQKELFAA